MSYIHQCKALDQNEGASEEWEGKVRTITNTVNTKINALERVVAKSLSSI